MTWREWSMSGECPEGWSHHGLAVLRDGSIAAYHPGERRLLFFDRDGVLLRSVPCEATEAHAIAEADDGLWIADCGNKLRVSRSGALFVDPPKEESIGRVLLVGVDGTTTRSIDAIDHPAYAAGGLFLPTGVAVDERGLWIADGYGSNLVHLVTLDGDVLLTLDGFDCPHGIVVDRRRAEPLLYVAERGAHRLCVYDLDGAFVRHAGVGDLIAPCALAVSGDGLHVADLVARVSVFDLDDRLVTHVGADGDAARRDGWPNAVVSERPAPPSPTPERFNSPHGIAADGDGHVFVTEWLLGGRWVRYSSTTMNVR
jgi:DNA-binding beta-propeller fold protein YncE